MLDERAYSYVVELENSKRGKVELKIAKLVDKWERDAQMRRLRLK